MDINFVTKEIHPAPATDAEVIAQVVVLVAFCGLTAYTIKKMFEPFEAFPKPKKSPFR